MARYLRPWVTSTKHGTQLSLPCPRPFLISGQKYFQYILITPLWLSGIKCQPHIRDWLEVSLMVLIYIDRIVDGCQRIKEKSTLQLNPDIFSLINAFSSIVIFQLSVKFKSLIPLWVCILAGMYTCGYVGMYTCGYV